MRTIHVRPVLVESKTYSDLVLCAVDNYLHKTEHYGLPMESSVGKDTYQQIILISLDEKIEVGDYAIDDFNYLIKIKSIHGNELSFIPLQEDIYCNVETFHSIKGYKKVIATQEQLSPEYILQFMEEYNRKDVKDIEIEMNVVTMQQSSENYEDNDILVNGKILESIDHTLTEEIDILIEKYNQPKLTNGFITIVKKEPILYSEREIDYAYLLGVFNVVGIDGLQKEIDRLKKLDKSPHDIIIAARKHYCGKNSCKEYCHFCKDWVDDFRRTK